MHTVRNTSRVRHRRNNCYFAKKFKTSFVNKLCSYFVNAVAVSIGVRHGKEKICLKKMYCMYNETLSVRTEF